jgi:hypothetical protein
MVESMVHFELFKINQVELNIDRTGSPQRAGIIMQLPFIFKVERG